MNQFLPPDLRALEARLRATPPQMTLDEQHQILYQCAFTAGQLRTDRRVMRWRVATAALGIAFSISLLPSQLLDTSPQPDEGERAIAVDPPVLPAVVEVEDPLFFRPVPTVKLDAWQLPEGSNQSTDNRLARSDDTSGILKVGTLWQAESF